MVTRPGVNRNSVVAIVMIMKLGMPSGRQST